ncbi:helix-turn-helix domain-containing protein, partial [Galactobacillus timonensis]|uniref:helix-turn-helix domain-containing protein n=1 Tax=Galactobacillus timonensis TaxID=2041840 RepID=UPI00240A0F3E
MEAANKQSHLTFGDRQIIQKGIENGSSKKAMADLLGKDKSTIGKEIKLHRELSYKCSLPLECAAYAHCRLGRLCTVDCTGYVPFTCARRDRSPGACNGCGNYSRCRFNKFRYLADHAHSAYRDTLVESRSGVNSTVSTIRKLGELIKPLLEKGQSVYAILEAHPEIGL